MLYYLMFIFHVYYLTYNKTPHHLQHASMNPFSNFHKFSESYLALKYPNIPIIQSMTVTPLPSLESL